MPETPKVLVIESDEELSQALAARLESEGFRPQLARNRTQAFALLRNLHFDVVFSDAQLSDGDGEQCYLDAIPFLGSTPVIFATAAGRVDQVVRLLKAGVVDCVQIPYDLSDLVERLRNAVERQGPRQRFWPDPIMVSPVMRELGSRLQRIAATNINLVVTGEPGSGKETIARYLHRLSRRSDEPFTEIACASLNGADGERFLFGERIRSADESSGYVKAGVLEEVGCGTLFLNEIEDIAPALQNRLAQVMDEDRLRRIGDIGSLPFEGRIVAATELSSAGLRERLRPSLFHRLAVLEIEVPPLRERQADIGPLTEVLAQEVAFEFGVPVRPIEADALSALSNHDWPGNVRELRNRLMRAMSFASNAKIGIRDLFPDIRLDEGIITPLPTLEEARSGAERQRIVDALAAHEGRIGQTAHSLGISRVTLWGKMKRLGISGGADNLFLGQKIVVQKKSQASRAMDS
jgi:DNA-binding NtrC family response regulator